MLLESVLPGLTSSLGLDPLPALNRITVYFRDRKAKEDHLGFADPATREITLFSGGSIPLVAHELTHVLAPPMICADNPGSFISEGLATYAELALSFSKSAAELYLLRAKAFATSSNYKPLREYMSLRQLIDHQRESELYDLAGALFHFLFKTRPAKQVWDFYRSCGDVSALELKSFEELEREFLKHLSEEASPPQSHEN